MWWFNYCHTHYDLCLLLTFFYGDEPYISLDGGNALEDINYLMMRWHPSVGYLFKGVGCAPLVLASLQIFGGVETLWHNFLGHSTCAPMVLVTCLCYMHMVSWGCTWFWIILFLFCMQHLLGWVFYIISWRRCVGACASNHFGAFYLVFIILFVEGRL